jgi:uncharacterized phage-associated protein
MATYTANDVATEIRKRLLGVGAQKLHKLLYYCQAHHLATFAEPLFADSIMAWERGPVVGQLWYAEDRGLASAPTNGELGTDEGALNTIGFVLSRYGRLSGSELERLSHTERPWLDADKVRQDAHRPSVRIEQRAIADYFVEQADIEESERVAVDPRQKEAALAEASDFAARIADEPARRDDRGRLQTLRAGLLGG